MPIIRPDQSSGSGGGGLPSWITTVDTTGAEAATFVGALRVEPTYDTITSIIKGVAGQVENLTEWQDSTGAIQAAIGAFGDFRVTTFDVTADGITSRLGMAANGQGFTNAAANVNELFRFARDGSTVVTIYGAGSEALEVTPIHSTDVAFTVFVPAGGYTANFIELYDPTIAKVFSVDSGGKVIATGQDTNPIASGALPTVAPVSATAFQCSTTRDVALLVPVTYNPGVATTATCKVELSPDNTTFSTLITITKPVGTVFDGSIEPVSLSVPAAWYVKLTVTNATLGTGTYY